LTSLSTEVSEVSIVEVFSAAAEIVCL